MASSTAMVPLLVSLVVYALLGVAGLWCLFYWSYAKLLRAAFKVPVSLPTLPLLGHAHYTVSGIEKVTEYALKMSYQAVARGLGTVCFWCGPLPIMMIHDTEDIKMVLNSSKTFEKGDEMNYVKYAMGDGLITAPGYIWKVTRRHMNPLFHQRNLERFTPTFNKNSRALVERLSYHAGRGPVNIMEGAMDTALQTICHLLFGPEIEFDLKSASFQGLKKILERIPNLFIIRILRFWLRSDTIFRFLYRKELDSINRYWDAFTETPLKIATKKKEMRSRPIDAHDVEGLDAQEGPLNIVDVYSVLQQNYPQFTSNEMRNEIITLYVTSTMTISVGMCSCILSLAQYQDIQEKLYHEISSVVGLEDDITIEDLQRMPYLDQVIKETLRIFTLVPYVLRRTDEDVKLKTCTVPKGNTIVVGIGGAHMDPTIYPDPHKFDPERFSNKNTKGNDRYAFIPFSAGPRNCIAKAYAMIFIKILIVQMLRTYKLIAVQDIHKLRKKLVIILMSAEGYKVTLEKRR